MTNLYYEPYLDIIRNVDIRKCFACFKEYMSDPVTNYSYIEDAKKVYRLKKLMPTNEH